MKIAIVDIIIGILSAGGITGLLGGCAIMAKSGEMSDNEIKCTDCDKKIGKEYGVDNWDILCVKCAEERENADNRGT